MKIVIPEINNEIMQKATASFPDLEIITAPDLDSAAELVASKKADTIV